MATSRIWAVLERRQRPALAAILLVGLAIRLPFSPFDLHLAPPDIANLSRWALTLAEHGPAVLVAREQMTLYPPLSMLLLWLAGVASIFTSSLGFSGGIVLVALIKLIAMVADVGLAWVVASALRNRPAAIRLAGAALVAFNPAFWYLSTIWGQIDSLYVLFAVIAVVQLDANATKGAWVAYALAVASKVQPLALAPLLVARTLRRHGPRVLLIGLGLAALALGALFVPWLASGQLPHYLRKLGGTPPVLDESALNIWFLVGSGKPAEIHAAHWTPGGIPISASVIGLVLLAGVVALVCVVVWRCRSDVGLALPATVLAMAPYVLMTGMRERYLIVAIPFALLAAIQGSVALRRSWGMAAFAVLTGTVTLNLLAVASPARSLWTDIFQPPVVGPLVHFLRQAALVGAALNTALLLALVMALLRVLFRAEPEPAGTPGYGDAREPGLPGVSANVGTTRVGLVGTDVTPDLTVPVQHLRRPAEAAPAGPSQMTYRS